MKIIFGRSLFVTGKNDFSTTCLKQNHVLVSVISKRFCGARQIKNFGPSEEFVKKLDYGMKNDFGVLRVLSHQNDVS